MSNSEPSDPPLMGVCAPSTNDVVYVRGRRWEVIEAIPSTLPVDVTGKSAGASTAVRLKSLGEDSMGEEGSFVWELEPGRSIAEGGSAALPVAPVDPDGFDAPSDLEAFLDAMRWGAVSFADPKSVQSPFRSGVSMEDYQLEPVVRAMRMPRANLLIADDVGLGKTIEAGLVVQELLTRQRIEQVLVVCPAGLVVKWQEEMRTKFGLEFVIADSELMKRLRREGRGPRVNPWTHHPRLITSMDWLKREGHGGPLQLFRETLPGPGDSLYPRRYGLLIIDEAHNVAPSGTGKYATDSQRTKAIRTIAPHFEHKLFLSATPHNGRPESYSALLNLLDDQRFARGLTRQNPEQVDAVVVRRLKSELVDASGAPRFHQREVRPISVSYTEAERKLYGQLSAYGELVKDARAGGVRAPGEFVLEILKKRLLSSPQAFLLTLQKHSGTLAGTSESGGRVSRSRPAPGVLRRFADGWEEGYSDDSEYEDELGDRMVDASSMIEGLPDDAQVLLEAMISSAEALGRRPDSKAKELIRFLDDTCRSGDEWNDERVIVFTEYRATQNWLIGLLAGAGIKEAGGAGRLRVLYGGMDPDERERIKAEFQADPSETAVRVLLATDMASEGIDLQNHCHRMVHYELPWNPSVLEQRNGRIDRHGQDHAPLVYHFLADQSGDAGDVFAGDEAFLARIVEKVEEMSTDLRGKVNPILSRAVKERMVGDRTKAEADLSLRPAPDVGSARATLEANRRKIADEVRSLRERLNESKVALHVEPHSVRRVVEVALRLAGQPPLEQIPLSDVAPEAAQRHPEATVYRMPRLRDGWASCTAGLLHPLTNAERPITFHHEIATKGDRLVLAHLNHPLVRMAQFLLRSEAEAAKGRGGLTRISVRVVPDGELEGPTAVVWGRLLVVGGGGHRLHEELLSAAVRAKDGRLRRIDTVSEVDRLAALPGEPADTAARQGVLDAWGGWSESLSRALEARVSERTKNLDSIIQRRAVDEGKKVESIFDELRRQIESALAGRDELQLTFDFGDSAADELAREQFDLDSKSLEQELSRIPERIQKEKEQVVSRFRDPRPRGFPVAVEVLIPNGWRGN